MDQWLSRRTGLALGLVLLWCSSAFAQPVDQPLYGLFDRVGVIDSVDTTARSIVVNDVRYYLPPAVPVYPYDRTLRDPQALRAENRLRDSRVLRPGMRIGYSVTGEGGGQRAELTEAWLLPAGNLPELGLSPGGRSDESSTTKAPGNTRRTPPAR